MPNHYALQAGQCNVWAAVVFSTTVHSSDKDESLDAWKTAQGYTDVRDGSWVPLTGAQSGHHDLFVQYDYMVGTDGHSHQPSLDALNMVQAAFLNHNIYVHFVPGNAITEDTCTTDYPNATPPNYCMFPNEQGVVAWKTGLEAIKAWPANMTSCAAGGNCTPRFQPGRKDSYHYVLFGHSLALPTWSVQAGTLQSIQGSTAQMTVTTSAAIDSGACPARVTIDGALANPNLNGVYLVGGCSGNTLTLSNINPNANVSNVSYPGSPPEPQLAIYSSTTDTTSGFSDVGGGDTAITLGKWGTQAQLVNVQAGTLMHELGHTLGLTHGGRYYPNGSTTPAFEQNCKPNYQSVMNYLFQVDLLQSDSQGDLALDYSDRALNALNEGSLNTQGLTGANGPAYPYTKWYSPSSPTPDSTAASSHCDGTPIGPNDPDQTMFETEGPASPISWTTSQEDVNFDGSISLALDGYDDWDNLDLGQIGASGNDNVSGLIYLIGNEYQLPIGSDSFGGGGGIRAAGGGGGGIRAAGGGGGGISAGGGGGGGIRAAGGGGGGIRAAGGGGGGIRAAGGGGGGMREADYPTIDSYARPPRDVMANGGVVTWEAPTFGVVQQYNVYSSAKGFAAPIATVPATTYSFQDPSPVPGATYYVTTVDQGPAGQSRESTPTSSIAYQAALTLNPANPTNPPLTYNSSETLGTSGGSGRGTVTYQVSGSCTLTGAQPNSVQLTANSGTGSCSVTATKAGSVVSNDIYNPVTSPPLTVPVQPANAKITVSPYSVVYDGNPHTATGTATGIETPPANLTALLSLSRTTHTNAGKYTDSWTFAGNNNYNPLTGTVTDTIAQANTATALSATPNPTDFGQSVSLRATVTPVAPGAGTATGTVKFNDGSTTLASVTMSNSAATFTTSSLAAGTHNLTALYSGDANFILSTSAILAEQVLCGVLLSISPSTVRQGGTVTVTAQVISCATTAQTVVVDFLLTGPLQPNRCGSTKSDIFKTPPFTLPPKTSKTVSFPFPILNGVCTGTYSITATTLVGGKAVSSSTASLTVTSR